MTVTQRAFFSFVLSAVLVGGIAALAYTGIFDLIESRFYNPAASEGFIRETARDAMLVKGHLSDLQNRFMSVLSAQAVRRSFLPLQDAGDIYERSRLFGELLESVPALHSVRFVDSAGSRIHFSTHPTDIVRSNAFSVTYKSYGEDPAAPPFDEVYVSAWDQGKLTLDSTGDRIVFSFPLFDSLDVYQGVALFAVSTRVLVEAFAAAGRRGVGENIVLVAASTGGADLAGFIDAFPEMSGDEIVAGVSSAWSGGYRSIVPLVASNATFALVSVPMNHGLYFGRIINEAALHFSRPIKNLVLITIFSTLFLVVFFLLNFKQNAPAVAHTPEFSGEKKPAEPPQAAMPKKAAEKEENEEKEELEELEAIEEKPKHGGGLLAAAVSLSNTQKTADPAKQSDVRLAFGDDDIPYIVETNGYQLIDDTIDDTIRLMENEEPTNVETIGMEEQKAVEELQTADDATEGQYAELEVVSPFTSMFSSLGDAETQAKAGQKAVYGEVIVEQGGVPYINGKAVGGDTSTAEKLDGNFAKLVKSVTDKEQA